MEYLFADAAFISLNESGERRAGALASRAGPGRLAQRGLPDGGGRGGRAFRGVASRRVRLKYRADDPLTLRRGGTKRAGCREARAARNLPLQSDSSGCRSRSRGAADGSLEVS